MSRLKKNLAILTMFHVNFSYSVTPFGVVDPRSGREGERILLWD